MSFPVSLWGWYGTRRTGALERREGAFYSHSVLLGVFAVIWNFYLLAILIPQTDGLYILCLKDRY